MAISTSKISNADVKGGSTREKVAYLKQKHLPLFAKEGVANPKFFPKMAYKHNGELVISFFEREIYGGVNIYTEFVSRDYTPEDKDRRLFKWIYNPEYKTEYVLSEPHQATGDRRYLIPVDELINVDEYHNGVVITESVEELEEEESEKTSVEDEEIPFNLGDADADISYEHMTLRDYCAIQWKKPVSQRAWLNSLIKNTFGNE